MNIQRSERVLETIPVGSLGIIALPSCKNLGKSVDDFLVQWRHESANQHKDNIVFQGYEQRKGTPVWFRRGKRNCAGICPWT